MDSKLDSWLLDLKCRSPDDTRGNALLRLMADQKMFEAFLRHEKLTTISELRAWMLSPMKKV